MINYRLSTHLAPFFSGELWLLGGCDREGVILEGGWGD